jgi:hypothetical protein
MIKRLLLAFAFAVGLSTAAAAADITIPYTFVSGTTILSSQVNANFQALATKALNKTGDTITGTIAVSGDVTIDGVDISDYLNASGYFHAPDNGAAATPAFSFVNDTDTGSYLVAAGQLGWALGGTQRMLLNSSGLTVYGVNIISSTGKIPAVSATYFDDVTNVAFTNAANTFSGGQQIYSVGTSTYMRLNGTTGSNFLMLAGSGTGARSWIHYIGTDSTYRLWDDTGAADRLTLSTAGLLTVATVRSAYQSSDGTAGCTATVTAGSAGTITIKNGLITDVTGGVVTGTC